ncbi:ExbD/TolR family protein [Saccharicrinis sp. FJH54]|uniref:ExbD/TolR family protein n=1 Tax=Saccharicrinis sp. FJH54 TaxID=3344665 RepID=UPI0035D42CB5
MALKKHFLHAEIKEILPSGKRITTGCFIGFLFAVSIYGLLFVSREAVRYYSVEWDKNIWILNDHEVWFYNLFFAYISFIFGQSVSFLIWFYKPVRNKKRNRKRMVIINDQLNLNAFFLSWFAKLGFGYGLYFATECNYFTFSLLPQYKFLFVLIIFVLFLNSWMHIRRHYKKNALKWMGFSFLIISLFSFGLSFINIIDYKSINESVLKQNIAYAYQLELPEMHYYEIAHKKSLHQNHICVVRNSDPSHAGLFYNEKEISFTDLHRKLIAQKATDMAFNYQFLQLSIDKNISMGYVTQLIDTITSAGIYRFGFRVLPFHRTYDDAYYFKALFPLKMLPLDSAFWERLQDYKRSVPNQIIIDMSKSGSYEVNSRSVPENELKTILTEKILQNPDYIVFIKIKDQSNFDSFMNIYDAVYQIIGTKRDEASRLKYGSNFDNLDSGQMDDIMNSYPIRISYLTREFQLRFEEN